MRSFKSSDNQKRYKTFIHFIEMEISDYCNEGRIARNRSSSKKDISFEVGDFKFNAIKYSFEYPKSIQNETGILGYKRTIVKDKDVEKLGVKKLNQILSCGEFPNRTLNHSIGAHQGGPHKDFFIQDKFFIQKLFDINLTKKIKLGKRNTSSDSFESIVMGVYDKMNCDAIGEVSTHLLSTYEEEIKSNEVFLIGHDAFNTSAGNFWGFQTDNRINFGFSLNDNLFANYIKKAYEIFLKNNLDTKKELIGIEQIVRMVAFCDNDFFEEYKRFFKESENSLEEESIKGEEERLSKIFSNLRENFLPHFDQDEVILNKRVIYVGDGRTLKSYNYNERFVDKINNIMDLCLSWDKGYMAHTTRDFLKTSSINGNKEGSPGDKSDEIHIPIFINHPEIPQICWGHAKYANFMNEKGFNFFEFQHKD